MRYLLLICFLSCSMCFASSTNHYLVNNIKDVANYYDNAIEHLSSGVMVSPVFKNSNSVYAYWKTKRRCYLVSSAKGIGIDSKKVKCKLIKSLKKSIKKGSSYQQKKLSDILVYIKKSKKILKSYEFEMNRINMRKNLFDLDRQFYEEEPIPHHNLKLSTKYSVGLVERDGQIMIESVVRKYEDHNFWLPRKERVSKLSTNIDTSLMFFENKKNILIFWVPKPLSIQNTRLLKHYVKPIDVSEKDNLFYFHEEKDYCFWDYHYNKNDYSCLNIYDQKISIAKSQTLRAISISKNSGEIKLYSDEFHVF